MIDALRNRWDKLLDWCEFDACRWARRRWAALLLALALIAALLICGIAIARANAQAPTVVVLTVGTVEAIVSRIEQLEKENAELRERCAAGARGT